MIEETKKHPISPMLANITQQQVTILDQENTDGNGWDFYCNGQVTNAIVFEDEISAIVRELVSDYKVKIKVNEYEVSCSCNCQSEKVVCNHVVAVLYSWVYDQAEFTNVGDYINQLNKMDKNSLIDVVQRLLTDDPQNVKYFEKHGDDIDQEFSNIEFDSLGFE